MYQKLISSHEEHNNNLKQKTKEYLEQNPVSGAHKELRFKNIEFKEPKDDWHKLQEAQQSKKSVSTKVYADAEIYNKRTNRVEDRKRVYVGSIPHKNKLGTYMIEGAHYLIPHQFRLKPSGYTSIKNNGNIETMFNSAGGHPIKVVSPQSKDDLWIEVGSRKFNAYDIYRIMGASDEEIHHKLGDKLFNIVKHKSDLNKTLKSLAEVTKVVTPEKAIKPEGMQQIKESIMSGKLDPEATSQTLGVTSDHVNKDTLIAATNKVVKVKQGKENADDKENLIYKKVMKPEDLIIEGVKRKMNSELWKKRAPLNRFTPTKVEDVWHEPLLNKASKSFVTTSAISRMPEGYNPLQLQQIGADVTPLGEGGVKSSEVITPSMRGLHISQAGFIDPIKSPEGANTGITLSLTENSFVDKNNNPAMLVKNLKTNKLEVKTLKDLWNSKLAFPDPDKHGKVGIRHKSDLYEDHISKADYQIPDNSLMYGPGMNSLGLISANDPTRNLMASKHVLQALPLVDRDVPNVSLQTSSGVDLLKHYASQHLPIAPTDGKIIAINKQDGHIVIKGKDGSTHKISYSAYKTPLNAKTYLKHTPVVKVGDTVKKGQHLADSNFTKNGKYALGKNLRTAFMMYPGTRNDAFVVSESAAKKLTSMHSVQKNIDKDKNLEFSKKKFVSLFPDIAKKINLNNYDENGFLKSGVPLHKGEPLFLGVKKVDTDEIKFANDKVKKLLYGGYAPYLEEWKYSDPAKLDKLSTSKGKIRAVLTYKSPLKVGDKVAGRSGNKGIVSKVIPDHEMPHDENGPIDIIMGGAGIASRQNPAQVIEATLGAVSKKTGKNYVLPHHFDEDISRFAKDEAKKHNVKLYHKIYDPVKKQYLKQKVFVGDYHVQKLFKQGDSAWSAIGYGATDGLDQPKKGGKTSASSISNMEVNALLAHGAKDFLRETFNIRSQKNRDWFSAYLRGDALLPAPESKTSLEKFKGLLNQMHMKVVKHPDGKLQILPMTDKDIVKMSNGEVKESFGLKQGTLNPIKHGFYDTHIFGGNGQYWGHVDLGTKIINPNYKDFIAKTLKMSNKELDKHIENGEIGKIEQQLKKVDLNKIKAHYKNEIKKTNDGNKINQAFKTIKAIDKLQKNNIKLHDVAFISKMPILPTKYRPVSKMQNGTVVDHDINNHYTTIINAANTLKEAEKELGEKHHLVGQLKTELQKHVGAMYGINESPDPVLKRKQIKSVQEIISGAKPKESLWQTSVLQNKVFSSGRAVIIPKDKYLGMDEVEIPKNVAWKIFEPHITRGMAQTGMSSIDIQRHIENKTPTATKFLHETMQKVPVVINRAPTLHKHNMIGAYAKISPDDAMRISPLHENPQNADYDGDQLAIHAPLTQKAIDDVKNKMLASKQLFGEKNKDNIQMGIDLDPFVGFYHATKYPNGKTK